MSYFDFDCLVIGAGPAALSASIYLGRGNVKHALFEGNVPGGKLVDIHRLENYPGYDAGPGADLALRMMGESSTYGGNIIYEKVTGVGRADDGFAVFTENKKYVSKTVILATGLVASKGIEGEKKYLGRGVSHCASCDANFYKGLRAVVIGNGARVAEETLYIARVAREVVLICPDPAFKGGDISKEDIRQKGNIEVIEGAKPVRFVFNEELGKVDEFVYEVGGETLSIKADGFFAYGKEGGPEALLSAFPELEWNGPFLKASPIDGSTSVPGLYAAGDCCDIKLRQVVTAASMGALAANSVISLLSVHK